MFYVVNKSQLAKQVSSMYKFSQLLLLLFPLLIVSCGDNEDIAPPPPPMLEVPFTFLALGDSYTIGTSVEPQQRWPRQLLDRLESQDVVARNTDNVLDIVATNGWTTRQLINGIAQRNTLRSRYDLVSLLIGVNNQFQGRSIEEYRIEFAELLNTAIGRAGGDKDKVFVVSIPDYAFTPFGGEREDITNGVNEFNAAAKQIAEENNIAFYNITPISRDGIREPDLVAQDNLHPSGEQYTRWVMEVLFAPVAEKVRG